MTRSARQELRFASALSTNAETAPALDEACRAARETLGEVPDLAVVFVSHHHAAAFEGFAAGICDRVGTNNLLGCSGESIVGTGREIESRPAVSLWLATLPGARLALMHLQFTRTPEGGSFIGWPDDLPDPWPAGSALLVLGEPYSFPADALLERINEDQPGVPIIGGMASGGGPGENRVFIGRECETTGAAALLVAGGVRVRTVVSQGCRPIGSHYVVTRAERNVIFELGGKPPLGQLETIMNALPTREQRLMQRGLHLGRVVSEYQESFSQGDFLVRNVIGADPKSGAIAVGDSMRAGQTVQFHIRDDQTADAELRQLLREVKNSGSSPRAALLFTCNGRGTRLFPGPDHDAGCVRDVLGDIPLAGFFAQGELGPVGGRNFQHGFTASLALFEAESS
jgi:small ligand-binding sensory domain FIST